MTYETTVYQDRNGNKLITSLSTMIETSSKAKYKKKAISVDFSINQKTVDEILGFLNIFFKLYPSASEKELEYYIEGSGLRPIKHELVFEELINSLVVTKSDKDYSVNLNVRYIDPVAKATQSFSYDLLVRKDGKWKIVS